MTDQITYTFACGRFYLAVIDLTHEGDQKNRLHRIYLDRLDQIKPEPQLPEELRERFTALTEVISSKDDLAARMDEEIWALNREVVNLFGALSAYEAPGP